MTARHQITTRSGNRSGGTAGQIADYPSFNQYHSPDYTNFTILSWNTNGLKPSRNLQKQANLKRVVKGWRPDFILLQETHLTHEIEYHLTQILPNYKWAFCNFTSSSRGVAIGTKDNNNITYNGTPIKSGNGKWILWNITFRGSNLNIVSVYKPPLEDHTVLEEIINTHKAFTGEPGLIVGGDLNTKPGTSEMTEALRLFATVHSSPVKFKAPTHSRGSQIDHLFIHDKYTTDIQPFFQTIPNRHDHCFIICGLDRFKTPCQFPNERIPPAFCDNPNFINECLALAGEYTNEQCPFIYLRNLKESIRTMNKKWNKETEHKYPEHSYGKRMVLLNLVKYVDRISSAGNFPKPWLKLEPLKSILRAAYANYPGQPKATAARRELIKRIKESSKILHTDIPHLGIFNVKKPTSSFNFKWKPSPRAIVTDDDGLPIRGVKQQHEQLKTYWRKIFENPRAWDTESIQELMGNRPVLPNHAPATFTKDEIVTFIKKKRRTAPGPDGIPLNFYANTVHHKHIRKMWKAILKRLGDSQANIPEWFVEGNLMLFPKDNGTIGPDKFRPITVSNADYRLSMGLWAKRLATHLNDWISPPQRAQLKGRNIRQCIECVGDLWFQREWERKAAHLLQIDFAKAFDFINREAIKYIMQVINLPTNISAAISHALQPAPTYLCTPGHPPSLFVVKNGVKQGCPTSPLVFIMIEDLLVYALHKTQGIMAMGAYADDIAIILNENTQELSTIGKHILCYCRAVGAAINPNKCSILSTHPGQIPELLPEPWNQVARPRSTTYLGITIGPNMLEREHWNKALRNALIVATKIKQQKWSLGKRIKMINTFIIPLFSYIHRHYLMPRTVVSKLNKHIRLALGNYRTIPDSVLYAVDGPFRLKNPIIHPFFLGLQTLALSPAVPRPPTTESISPMTIFWHQNTCHDIIAKRLDTLTITPPTTESNSTPQHRPISGKALRYALIRTLPTCTTWKLVNSIPEAKKATMISNLFSLPSYDLKLTFTLLMSKEWSLGHQFGLRTGRSNCLCALCGQQEETYKHILLECPKTKELLNEWHQIWIRCSPLTAPSVSWPEPGADLIGSLQILAPQDMALRAHLINLLRSTIASKRRNQQCPTNHWDDINKIFGAIYNFLKKTKQKTSRRPTTGLPTNTTVPANNHPQLGKQAEGFTGYFDGSSHKFPPVGGGGYVVLQDGVEIRAAGFYLPYHTSNEAESKACAALMQYLTDHQISEATIYGDSQIIINHLKGKRIYSEHRWADCLIPSSKPHPPRRWTFVHIAREENKRADAIANAAAISQAEGDAMAAHTNCTTRTHATHNLLSWSPPTDSTSMKNYIKPLKACLGTFCFPIPKCYRPPHDPLARWTTLDHVADFRERGTKRKGPPRTPTRIPTISSYFAPTNRSSASSTTGTIL